jgi:hypothetical protein
MSMGSLEPLRQDLVRRGLPLDYVERVIGEMEDHLADLAQDAERAGPGSDAACRPTARHLGCPRRLADLVVSQFRAGSFCGRHPAIAFLLAPLPLVFLGWVLASVTLLSALAAMRAGFDATPPAAAWDWLCQAAAAVAQAGPVAGATVVFCRLSYRCGRGWPWAAGASGLLVLLTASFQSTVWMAAETGAGAVVYRWGLPVQFLQMLVPLGLGALLVARTEQSRRAASRP